MDVEELTTETNRFNQNHPVHSYNHHGQHNHHTNYNNKNHHDHEPSPSNLHTRLEDVENILTNSNTDHITFPDASNTHNSPKSPSTSSTNNHATTKKHANHLGHHLNQGPNYRSNAPPENIDTLHAQHHKDTTLKEEGFLCQFDCHNGKCITFSQVSVYLVNTNFRVRILTFSH